MKDLQKLQKNYLSNSIQKPYLQHRKKRHYKLDRDVHSNYLNVVATAVVDVSRECEF